MIPAWLKAYRNLRRLLFARGLEGAGWCSETTGVVNCMGVRANSACLPVQFASELPAFIPTKGDYLFCLVPSNWLSYICTFLWPRGSAAYVKWREDLSGAPGHQLASAQCWIGCGLLRWARPRLQVPFIFGRNCRQRSICVTFRIWNINVICM